MKSLRSVLFLMLVSGILAAAVVPANAVGIFGVWQNSKDPDNGFGLGVSQNFQLVPLFSIDGRLSWIGYSEDGVSTNMFPIEVFGRVKLGILYGGAGIGYYIFSGDATPDNELGGFIAAGGEFTLLGLGAFGELRYLFLKPEFDTGAGKSDVDFSGIGAALGVILPF